MFLMLLPGGFIFERCVEDDEELVHDCDECCLSWFTGVDQSLMEVFQHWIEPSACYGHGEHRCMIRDRQTKRQFGVLSGVLCKLSQARRVPADNSM